MTATHTTNPAHDFVDREPAHQITWVDPVTGAHGYLVVHTLVGGIATGGTRMRPGCTISEVGDLARGMATKTAAFGLPVGGAKGEWTSTRRTRGPSVSSLDSSPRCARGSMAGGSPPRTSA